MSKVLSKEQDPMGRAIADYHATGKVARLRVFSPLFDEDEIPVPLLFRSLEEMPPLERRALESCRGRVLDVGAGAGCHALALQARQLPVTALDISPLAVETMTRRGVKDARLMDFFDFNQQVDTVLMLMNGIGIVGTICRLPVFFEHLKQILSPGGQLLCDSSDLRYVFENEAGEIEPPYPDRYYGEMNYWMQYRGTKGPSFDWLYIDAETLKLYAGRLGFDIEIIVQGEHYDYLARISLKKDQHFV